MCFSIITVKLIHIAILSAMNLIHIVTVCFFLLRGKYEWQGLIM